MSFRLAFPTAKYNASQPPSCAMGLFAYEKFDAGLLIEKPIDHCNLHKTERAQHEPDEAFA